MKNKTRAGSAAKIKLGSFEELIGGASGNGSDSSQVINIPLYDLYDFKGHPFRVSDDEKMAETAESIAEHGVLVPGIARIREGGGYEIIAGHRRKRGCEIAGKTEMPFLVRNYTDDEAVEAMRALIYLSFQMKRRNVDRESIVLGKYGISPELLALGRQIKGRRMEICLSQEAVAEKAGISANTVSRIEHGQMAMSIETFCRLLYILDVDACRLLGACRNSTKRSCCCQDVFRRLCRLGKQDQEIVLAAAEKLLDGIPGCAFAEK